MDTPAPATPERKRFNHITVSNLVSPVTSLFRTSKKTSHKPVAKSSEISSIRGPRYDNYQSRLSTLSSPEKPVAITLSRNNLDKNPRPSIGALLESFVDKERKSEELSQAVEETPENKEKLLKVALDEIQQYPSFPWNEYMLSKEELENQTKTIEDLKAKLKTEMRMRDGAATLIRAQKDKKLSKQARGQFETSERRVGQLSSEIWRLSQSTNYIHQRLLQHTAVILGRAFQGEDIPSDYNRNEQRNSSIGDDPISILKEQLSAMSSKLDSIIDSKEEHANGNINPEISHEHKPRCSINSWGSEKDETIHLLTEQVSSLKAELQFAQEKLVDFERKSASQEVDNPRVNDLVRTSLKNAIVEKERYRIELEKEKALRADLVRQMEELQHKVDQNSTSGHEENLRTTLEESIRDFDALKEENQYYNDALRQLFALCPNYSPTHTYSDDEEEEKFTLDGFMDRITYLIEENHHLMDRVLELQSENEQHRSKARQSRNGLENAYESPIPTPNTVQSRLWLDDSSDEEYRQT
ncbi:hypothetical protein K7432_010770 [Basidiobolus ranarum]|uniref:REM-1 domain-containing protein n=1 Tax=Basidiobolus ranarum TaxID=34480 RepID=A0ABR2WNE5_9FUNG